MFPLFITLSYKINNKINNNRQITMEKVCFELQKFYDELSREKKKEFRDTILVNTELSLPAFYNKMREGKWTNLEKRFIAEILKKELSNIIFNKVDVQ